MRAVVPGDLKLTAVRDNGQWEAWLRFFLEGVLETATEATKTAQHIHELREADRRRVPEAGGGAHELELLDRLFAQPLVNGAWGLLAPRRFTDNRRQGARPP